jgi:outer membrane protein assembly factor BamD (BamD/ComL family)
MKRYTILLILIAFVLALFGCQQKPKGPGADEIFALAKKYQGEAKTDSALMKYEELVKEYPKDKFAAQSQFMVGFICANEKKDFARAETAYKAFLANYGSTADSGMVASAKWELANLGKDIGQIQDLNLKGGESAKPDTVHMEINSQGVQPKK